MGSNHYIFFGKVELTVQAAPGTGIVTSFVLQSDNLDEIDWEWLGYHPNEVQTNYFGKGDDSTFDRGGFHEVNGVQSTQHTYTIDWTKEYVRWYVNGNQIRELLYADAKGGSRFPQTPMQIRLGTWVAGRSDAPEGTVQWSGGLADFSNGPSKAYYKSIKITDYSNGVKGATEYEWAPAPNDGSYEIIKVITGDGSEGSDNSTSTTSAASSSATKTDKDTKTDEPKPTSTGSDSGSSNSTVTTSTGVRPTNNPVPGGNDTSSGPSSGSGSGSGSSPSPSASAPPQSGATFMAACSTALLGAGLLVSFFAL
jgi:beta-glucanase (GH16 family)